MDEEFICISCEEVEKVVKEITDNKALKDEIKSIQEKNFTLKELNSFFEKKENIKPAVEKILELENKGYLTRKDSYAIFFANSYLEDPNDYLPLENTEENKLKAIEFFRENESKEKFEQLLKGLIDPQKNHTPKEWKDFLLKHKYIDSHGKIIYKRKRRSR